MHKDEHHLSPSGDWLMSLLNNGIGHVIRILAIMMMFVVVMCVADVGFVLYEKLTSPPLYFLNLNDIFAVFASFLAVLIAIEIFANITLYLRDDVIHIRLVVATALMAIARKVIVLDFTAIDPQYVYATGVVVLALGITYFLVAQKART